MEGVQNNPTRAGRSCRTWNDHKGGRNHVRGGDAKEETISDEQAYKKGFRENVGIFLVTGTLYRTTTITWIHFTCFNLSCLSLLFCLCRTALLFTDNMTTLFETLHWVAIILTVLSGVPSSFPNTPRFNRIFTSFGKDVFTYAAADEETTEEIKILRQKGETEKKLLVKLFSVMLLSAYCGFAILLPAYSIYTGKFFEPQRSDGVIMGIPCVIWIPAQVDDRYIVTVRIAIMLVQGYISGTVINLVISEQGSAICIGHKLLYEFKNGERLFDILFVHELSLLIASTVLICLSTISLVSDVPVASKIVSLIFTGAELGNVFVGCFYGQVLLDSHQLVASALYDSNWPKYSTLIGKHVLIMLARLQRPLSLTAGGFAAVNLDTFAQVVKSSFSYFSLLQALKE